MSQKSTSRVAFALEGYFQLMSRTKGLATNVFQMGLEANMFQMGLEANVLPMGLGAIQTASSIITSGRNE